MASFGKESPEVNRAEIGSCGENLNLERDPIFQISSNDWFQPNFFSRTHLIRWIMKDEDLINKTEESCKKIDDHKAPSVGIEPTTTWLKATRSTTELGRLVCSF